MQSLNQPDYQYLGADIDVTPDLDENETLRVDADCLVQDIINGWTQPTGIADGTIEGEEWGIDIRAQLGRGFTESSLFALKVSLEVQAERDDRVDSCTVGLTYYSDGSLVISGRVFAANAPYPFSLKISQQNVSDLYIQRLG